MSGVLTQRHRGTEKRKLVDSGVAWIGKIPEGWKVSRIKYETETRNDVGAYNPESDRYIGLENLIPYGEALIQSDTTYPVSNYSVCKKDDILFSKLRPYLAKCIIAPSDAFCTGEFVVIKSFSGNKVFLRYWLLADNVLSQIVGSTYGAKMPRAAESFILNLPISIPPLAEQQRIAAFLDRECEKIDGLRGKIEKQIEKLDELKKSTITEAVTKGLKRGRKMKPSGERWCPEIPDEWNRVNAKSLFYLRTQRALEEDKQLTSSQKHGIIPQDEFMRIEGQKVVTVEKDFSILKHVEPGDFVISMRSFQGGLEYSCVRGCISSAYIMLIPNAEKIYPPFYRWFFKSSKYINAIQSTSNLVRDGQAMRYANFAQVPLFEVPLAEQKEIAEYLDKKCAAIDAAKEKCRVQLEKLAEYKKSLIYEYVTGKKEVD